MRRGPKRPARASKGKRRRPPAFPPLPAELPGVLGPIRVLSVPEIPTPEDDPDLIFGLWDPLTRSITVRVDVSLEMQWSTLYHEEAHAAFADAGLRFPPGDLEERACDAVALARLAVLKAAV